MKRLTRRLADGRACFKPHLYGKMNKDVCDRLAAIEDILGDDYDLDRLRELAQADREGITPCTFCRFNPPLSCDGKPCCMCPAEKKQED